MSLNREIAELKGYQVIPSPDSPEYILVNKYGEIVVYADHSTAEGIDQAWEYAVWKAFNWTGHCSRMMDLLLEINDLYSPMGMVIQLSFESGSRQWWVTRYWKEYDRTQLVVASDSLHDVICQAYIILRRGLTE